MEARRQTLKRWAHDTAALGQLLVALFATAWDSTAYALPLDQRIPRLFGGSLATFVDPRAGRDAQRPGVADRFRSLSGALAASRSQAPIASVTGAFSYAWAEEGDVYIRTSYSLGPGLAERAQTLGRGIATVSLSYTRVDYDTFEGESLRRVRALQPALTADLLARLPVADAMRAADDLLETQLDLDFGFDSIFLTAAYGVTERVDVSMALSLNRAHMSATAQATILDADGDGGAFFTVDQPGVVVGGSGPICSVDFRCATDSFDDSAFGTGDLFLRAKWHTVTWSFVDLAVAGVLTLPTGNADEFLGFHDPTFTPWLIASKTFGQVSPHVNLGYAVRSSQDVSQAQWIAGADIWALNWVTLAVDFLGFHDDDRDGINDNVYQVALGAKINIFGGAVFAGTVQLPLNRDGLRADVIYTLQLEHTF